MIVINIIFIIFILYLNYFKSNLNSSVIRRITAISFLYSGVLCLNTLYIQLIGSGVGMYSGLIEINILTNVFNLLILTISSILLLVWPSLNLYKDKKMFKIIKTNYNYNNILFFRN